jgi:hypothetical protein
LEFVRRGIDSLILAGALMFIFALAISAVFEPKIRLLHTLQALIYVFVIFATWRHWKSGYGAGIFIALFWNYVAFFINGFIVSGVLTLVALVTGQPVRDPGALIAVIAALGHCLMIIGCVIAYLRLPNKQPTDAFVLVGSGAAAILYFWAIIALTGPQYLPQFRRLFHLA